MAEPIKLWSKDGKEQVVYGHAQAAAFLEQGYTATAPEPPEGVDLAAPEDVSADVAEDADAPIVEVEAEAAPKPAKGKAKGKK